MKKLRQPGKKALSTLLIPIALVGSIYLAPKKTHADINGSLEAIVSEKKENSYARLNGFYQLPGEINGFTFLEFYKDGKGFFGKSMLTKGLSKTFSVKGELVHINEPVTYAGVGLGLNLPMPKGSYGSLKVLPVWVDKQGKYAPNKVIVGYVAGADLGKGWSMSSFGEANIAAKQGPKWCYGEVAVTKEIGKGVNVGYIPALKPVGKLAPKIESRVGVQIRF